MSEKKDTGSKPTTWRIEKGPNQKEYGYQPKSTATPQTVPAPVIQPSVTPPSTSKPPPPPQEKK